GVVVLNWNGAPLTIACLESIRRASGFPRDVVLVDNGSNDDSVAQIRRWATGTSVPYAMRDAGERKSGQSKREWLTIIRADSNRGFAPGNNHGIRFLLQETACTHVLLLNND